jgi:diguanylate cyclase (GGDEF)-like protein
LNILDGMRLNREDAVTATARIMNYLDQGDMVNKHFDVGDSQTGIITVVLTSPMAAALAEWQPWQQGLWVIGVLSMLFTGATGWTLARRVTQPIAQLVASAKAISSGDYSNNLQLPGTNEFNFLAISMNNMGKAVEEREHQIRHQAQHDTLTGLPNRNHLSTLITAKAPDTGAYLFLQLNGFQALTDTYGLDWADTLLKRCAALFQSALTEQDLLARVARDQFVVYCHGADKRQANRCIEHLLNTLAEPIVCHGIDINLELRVGAALHPEDGSDPEDLLRRASVALSNAGVGLPGICFYAHHQDSKLSRQQRVTQRLQQAIATNRLSLCFQPKLDLHRNRVTQVEALLRWDDEELGRVSPEEFIPLAERSGDIYSLSDWIMQEAARIVSEWQQQGMSIIMGINISGKDFKRENFVDKTLRLIEEQGAQPEQFLLEITESATMDSIEQAVEHLNALAEAGFGLAIDDFGTGFSSLSQLKRLPVNELKIDKSFIVELDADPSDYKIVRATINLGHNLGMTVVAEGVENQTSLQLLRQMGCDLIQGYHLSRPLNHSDFIQWWQEHDRHIAHAIDPNAHQTLLTT